MSSYNSAIVLCPFYVRDDPKTGSITCEGVPPGSSVRNHFTSGRALNAQIGKYCAGAYRKCPWARLLELGKYAD